MKREDMKREDDDPMRDSPRGKSRQTADMTGTGLRLELTGMTPPRVPLVSWGLLVLTGVYFLAGKFGLSLAFVHASASAVWPPTGIALAATLLLGYRVWPALFLGAFLVNVATAGAVWTSLGIAGGNTLEGLLGAFLVRRFANGLKVFVPPRPVGSAASGGHWGDGGYDAAPRRRRQGARAARSGAGPGRRDRGVLGRRDHRQDAGRDHHDLERGRRAALRVRGARGRGASDLDHHPAAGRG